MVPTLVIWYIFALATLFELVLLYVPTTTKNRLYYGSATVLLLTASHSALLINEHIIFGLPFFLLGMFRAINVMRFAYGRMHKKYLYKVCKRTQLWLIGWQMAIGISAFVVQLQHVQIKEPLLILGLVQLAVTVVGLFSIQKNSSLSTAGSVVPYSDNKLPSITVAIPARNETQDLADCLTSFVASDYQKLEILVLDDCSQEKTSDIIKQFAHQGVRFIRGDEPGDTWLAKNAAYEKLSHEASSKYILFCGVDVRVQQETLRNLVSYMLENKKSMLSVLPIRAHGTKVAPVVQQVRYLWELALPRFYINRPPVLSTLWIIENLKLKKLGGLSAVKRSIVPEGFFARELNTQNAYQFIRASDNILVQSAKGASEQRRTALRVRYPQLHKRPEMALAVIAFELLCIIGVLPVLAFSVYKHYNITEAVSAVTVVLQMLLLAVLTKAYTRHNLILHILQGFFTAPLDIWLILKSLYTYEFQEMYWKERNVCLPVMHVAPSLPTINQKPLG